MRVEATGTAAASLKQYLVFGLYNCSSKIDSRGYDIYLFETWQKMDELTITALLLLVEMI